MRNFEWMASLSDLASNFLAKRDIYSVASKISFLGPRSCSFVDGLLQSRHFEWSQFPIGSFPVPRCACKGINSNTHPSTKQPNPRCRTESKFIWATVTTATAHICRTLSLLTVNFAVGLLRPFFPPAGQRRPPFQNITRCPQ